MENILNKRDLEIADKCLKFISTLNDKEKQKFEYFMNVYSQGYDDGRKSIKES